MTNRIRIALACSLLLLNLRGAPAQEIGSGPITGPADVDTFILRTLHQYEVPGAAVAILVGGRPVIVKGYGQRDAKGAPVDADTLFQLASVSKTFTSLAFAAQATQGKADWNKPVRKVLEDFQMREKFATKQVTPLDLLVHRSGLAQFEGDLLETLGFDRAEILQRVRYMIPGYSFRYRAEYNNIGFFIAGEVTARLAGEPWEDAVKSLVLDPAGMPRTGLASVLMKDDPNTAQPFGADENGNITLLPPRRQSTLAPAGGLASTARDMAAYAKLLLDGGQPVVDEANLETLFEPVIFEKPGFSELAPISENTGFGYTPGWGVYWYGGQKILEKGGALDGFRTLITLVPGKKLALVVLCNKNLTAFPEAVRAEFIARTLGGPAAQWQKDILAAEKKIREMFVAPQPPQDAQPAPLSQWKYGGTYTSDLYGEWTVTYDKKTKGLKVTAGPAKYAGTLAPWDGNTFLLTWEQNAQNVGTDLEFKVEDGKVTGFTFDDKYGFTKK